MRLVLDTNVLVSALHFGGRPRRLLEAVLSGRHQLVGGSAILVELEAVLVETCRWERGRASAARSEVEAVSDIVTPVESPHVCRDPDDDEILAIAIAGKADALVTGDRDLLALRKYEGIRIVTVAELEHDERQE
jgi:putative PIN family toxin of toxin-antitoxin system